MEDSRELLTVEEYNNIPVYYCPRCLSLRIKSVNEYIDYCDNCGNTDIQECHIDEWQDMYNKRFSRIN